MAFHGYANALFWDSYTGDYGPGFLGHVLASATYIVDHPAFGTIAFGGNVQADSGDGAVTVQPRDSVRRRVYLAPLGLWVTFDAGVIQDISWDAAAKSVTINIGKGANEKSDVIMKFEQSAQVDGAGTVTVSTPNLTPSRGGYVVSVPETGTASVALGSQ